jgi:hypothetical protein
MRNWQVVTLSHQMRMSLFHTIKSHIQERFTAILLGARCENMRISMRPSCLWCSRMWESTEKRLPDSRTTNTTTPPTLLPLSQSRAWSQRLVLEGQDMSWWARLGLGGKTCLGKPGPGLADYATQQPSSPSVLRKTRPQQKEFHRSG